MKRNDRSAVRSTLDGQHQSLSRTAGSLRHPAAGYGRFAGLVGRRPPAPEGRPSIRQTTILPHFALSGHTWPVTLRPRQIANSYQLLRIQQDSEQAEIGIGQHEWYYQIGQAILVEVADRHRTIR